MCLSCLWLSLATWVTGDAWLYWRVSPQWRLVGMMRVYSRLILVAAAAVASSVLGASPSKTWTGASSTTWATSGNWSPSGAPASTDWVLIPVVARYPIITTGTTLAGFSMDRGSQLTLQTGLLTINGTQTVSLNGTIAMPGSGATLKFGTGVKDWTNLGVLDFSSGARFVAADVYYSTDRVLYNADANYSGTVRASSGSTIYLPFTAVVGGTIDGAWRPQSTLTTYFGNSLAFDGVTLGTSFLTDTGGGTYPGRLTLRNSVTNNSAAFGYPTDGAMALSASSGTFTFGGSGAFSLQGQTLSGTGVSAIANNGTHTVSGYGTIGAATLTNAGTIRASGGTSGASQVMNVGTLNNQGSVIVDQYNTLNASGPITSGAASLFHVDGTLSAPSVSVAGLLTGSGTIISPTPVMLAGTSVVAPGNSPGVLTIGGDLIVNDGTHWDIEAGDQINVNGMLEFLPGATVGIHLPSATPDGAFAFLTAANISGTPQFIFTGPQGTIIQAGDVLSGYTFSFQIPEPSILGIIGASSLLTLVRRRTAK